MVEAGAAEHVRNINFHFSHVVLWVFSFCSSCRGKKAAARLEDKRCAVGGVELSFPVTAHDALKHHLSTEAFRIHFDPFRAREWDQSEKSSGIYLQGFKAHYVLKWDSINLSWRSDCSANTVRVRRSIKDWERKYVSNQLTRICAWLLCCLITERNLSDESRVARIFIPRTREASVIKTMVEWVGGAWIETFAKVLEMTNAFRRNPHLHTFRGINVHTWHIFRHSIQRYYLLWNDEKFERKFSCAHPPPTRKPVVRARVCAPLWMCLHGAVLMEMLSE